MASKTFGGVLSVFDSTYKVVGGLIDVTFPALQADEPVDVTAHDSTSGVRVFTPAGTLGWTDGTFEANEIVADAGQAAVIAGLGTEKKFKFVSANGVTRYCNAIIKGVTSGANPINGKATISASLKASGVAPTS